MMIPAFNQTVTNRSRGSFNLVNNSFASKQILNATTHAIDGNSQLPFFLKIFDLFKFF